MGYPLPEPLFRELQDLILKHNGDAEALYDAFASLLVRQSRLTRRLLLQMSRSFSNAAAQEEDDARRTAACLGEDVLKDVANAIKDTTYHDTEAAKRRAKAVEDIIAGFYEAEDPADS